MKGLQFLGNRVEDAANAFIDVLMNNLALYSERADYDDVMYLLNKLIADEEHHIKLIKEAMGVDKGTKGVTVIIK